MHIEVRNVVGEAVATFDVDDRITVSVLKARIRQHTTLPAICQRLIVGTRVLIDDDRVEPKLWSSTEHVLTLVVCLDLARSRMSSPWPTERVECIEALAAVPDAEVIAEFIMCLQDENGMVRAAAARGLGKVAPPGNQEVVTALSHCLQDNDPFVRSSAVEGLRSVAQQGDSQLMFALISSWHLLEKEAVCLLKQLGGHPELVNRMRDLCEKLWLDGVNEQRRMTIEALGFLAESGDTSCIEVLLKCANGVDATLRQESIKSLVKIAPRGNERVILCLLSCLKDWHAGLKREALQGLGVLASVGDREIIAALCDSVENERGEERVCAAEALVRIAPRGHYRVRTILQECEALRANCQTVNDWLASC